MRKSYRTLALAISLAAAAAAFAQAPAPAKSANPAARGDNVFFYGPLSGSERANTIGNPLSNAGIGRPSKQSAQVTPVPEPSQWAMMLAGLALVGFIVRRNSKRS